MDGVQLSQSDVETLRGHGLFFTTQFSGAPDKDLFTCFILQATGTKLLRAETEICVKM